MIPFGLAAWAARHNVSALALQELAAIVGMRAETPVHTPDDHHSEAYVQSQVRLEAPHHGVKLFRNNVGVLKDETGRPVRYGLANDSKQVNEVVKSGDLIGWRRVLITPAHVGRTIAQFVSRECKRPGWTYTATDREVAQGNWAALVVAEGGDAQFTAGPGSFSQ